MSNDALISHLIAHARETAVLGGIEEMLYWDQRTLMPPKAAEHRAEQIALITGMIHRRTTAEERGQWLAELESQGESEFSQSDWVMLQRMSKQYKKEKKVPLELVDELTRVRVLAHESWVQARKNDKYSEFAPHLRKIVELLREKTAAIGYDENPYDVLLDDYEPDTKTSFVANVFEKLRNCLVPLIAKITGSKCQPDKTLVERKFEIPKQEQFGRLAAKAIGFDFDAGRLDVTAHPFCCSLGPNDCRITTRYNENHFNGAFFGILHEAGHGLYEQGLSKEHYGLPHGEYCSLGIHESQSRLWENIVGRSKAFWDHFFPTAKKMFSSLSDVTLDQFYGSVNFVEPSFIRVEADEATYSLHIIIRFELEQELISGDLDVDDLPDAWNHKYEQYLGIKPDSNADGVLQDVHWSEALFGYFPTYALGNLYAAQFFKGAEADIGDLTGLIRSGDFSPLLQWLRSNVHQPGRSLSALDILRQSTGEELSHVPMIENLNEKYSEIYKI